VAERVAEDAPLPVEGQSFEDRLDQVVAFLQEQGFLSRWEKNSEGYVLINVNCPYRRVSQQHGEVCLLDTELIRRLLGVEPKRESSMAAGGASCRYVIVPENG
jgi:DeoR family transcriptional regulator, suf operon transcriptional repressor